MNQKSSSQDSPMPGRHTIKMEKDHSKDGFSNEYFVLHPLHNRSTSKSSLIIDHSPIHEDQGSQLASSGYETSSQPCSCSCHTRSTQSQLYSPSHYSDGSYTHFSQDIPRYGYPDHNLPSHYRHQLQSNLNSQLVSSGYETSSQPYSCSYYTRCTQSQSHDPSNCSGNSYSHLSQDVPRYGYPDHYPCSHYHHHHRTVPTLSIPNKIPEISVEIPTPIMQNVPISPAETNSFSSMPNTPLKEINYQTLKSRPQYLPIAEKPARGNYDRTPISDNVMLYFQYHNGREAMQEPIKYMRTPGTERDKQLQRHLHDEELTFSSTDTEDDKKTYRRKRQTRKAVTNNEYGTKDGVFPRLPLSAIGKKVSDDSDSTDDSIMSSRPSSNPRLDPEESIITSAVKTFPNSVPRHLRKYDSASSGVYSSSDTENTMLLNNTPSYIPNHHKIHPVSSDREVSLSNREYNPSHLLLPLTLPNPMIHISAVSVSSSHKHHKKQTSPSNKQIDQDMLTGIL